MEKYFLNWEDFENAHFGKTHSRKYLTNKELKSKFLKDTWSEIPLE